MPRFHFFFSSVLLLIEKWQRQIHEWIHWSSEKIHFQTKKQTIRACNTSANHSRFKSLWHTKLQNEVKTEKSQKSKKRIQCIHKIVVKMHRGEYRHINTVWQQWFSAFDANIVLFITSYSIVCVLCTNKILFFFVAFGWTIES